jgi:N-methylhydantoinase B
LTNDGEEYTIGEVMAGGYGGSKDFDGLTHCTPPYATAQGRGVEVMESRGPVLFTEKHVRENSEGAGRRRGGFGTVYELELLGERASVSILGDRADFPPKGLCGGGNAKGAKITFHRESGEYVPPLKTKAKGVKMNKGDRFRMESPGGGGYGDPFEREPSLVLEDVQQGYITQQRAKETYGVVIESDGKEQYINENKTEEYRIQNSDKS